MYEFRKLADNVYVYIQPALIWYSTAGVIVGDRGVVVVDSLTNEAMTHSLLEEIRKVTDKPVTLLINTHAHADHVYTNHLFPSAIALCSQRGREKTREFQHQQALHDVAFARLFPDVDFAGGRYTLQDMTFTGAFSTYRSGREIRVLEFGPGHSESDVIVQLPEEGIVFCGDLFMNGLPPMPSEGHLTETIANIGKLEALGADTYIAGHGNPGTITDVAEQRILLESLSKETRQCFERGLSYDEAMETFVGAPLPVDFARPAVLSGYCEWAERMPASRIPAHTNHLEVMSGVARRAEFLLPAKGSADRDGKE
jgi:glyoxylase-like metal-dependent hydrolase (beta-lactamase superfamily II)